jgi:hypothetical protein
MKNSNLKEEYAKAKMRLLGMRYLGGAIGAAAMGSMQNYGVSLEDYKLPFRRVEDENMPSWLDRARKVQQGIINTEAVNHVWNKIAVYLEERCFTFKCYNDPESAALRVHIEALNCVMVLQVLYPTVVEITRKAKWTGRMRMLSIGGYGAGMQGPSIPRPVQFGLDEPAPRSDGLWDVCLVLMPGNEPKPIPGVVWAA